MAENTTTTAEAEVDEIQAPDPVVTWTDDDGAVHYGSAESKGYLRSEEGKATAAAAEEAAANEAEKQAKKDAALREEIKAEVRAELDAEADDKAKTNKSPNRPAAAGNAQSPQA